MREGCAHPHHPFYKKKVAFAGAMTWWNSEKHELLLRLGAVVTANITNETNIIMMGNHLPEVIRNHIIELMDEGCHFCFMNENIFTRKTRLFLQGNNVQIER